MVKLFKLNLIIGVLFIFVSCISSMSSTKFNTTLPTFTKSKFISQAQAEEKIKINKCKYLIRGRTYVAPIGQTREDDLKNGAKGIDKLVQQDGGNSYVIISYKWVKLNLGASQLHLEFDTMLCE